MKYKKKCSNSKNAVKDFRAYLTTHLGLETEFNNTSFSKFEVQALTKKKIIAKDGNVYLNSFWLQKGYGRFFKLEINKEGVAEEVTIDFCVPGEMIFVKGIFENESFKDFHFELASGSVIILLEEDYPDTLNLSELEAAKLMVKVMALNLCEQLKRKSLLKRTPKERYKMFLNHFGPHAEHYLLIKQIACYLRLQPSHLSRIRRELLKK